MSGIVGHSLYAVLGLKAAAQRKLPLVRLAQRHFASFTAGACIGCDIQVMPEAICVDSGCEAGFGRVPVDKSPITGGPVRHHAEDVLADMKLIDGECHASIRALVGLTYAEMIEAADKADFRHRLWQIGDEIAKCWRVAR